MREREVAVLAAQGLVNSEIADRLGTGAATVKTHVSALPEKFQVRNRAQLAVAAADRLTAPLNRVPSVVGLVSDSSRPAGTSLPQHRATGDRRLIAEPEASHLT